MQTLQADYFTNYRNLKLSRDAKGVLIAEFHSEFVGVLRCGSACIPMALDDAIELGKIKRQFV